MSVYYNEIDPVCADWLKALMAAGSIPGGTVDTRSIQDVSPEDLHEFTQCHFFAGIGGWAYAARLAGWPGDKPLWTGSCPCQPFSLAGKKLGADDPRHLWPDFFRLLRSCRPAVVMGEQVAAAVGYAWLDGVGADLDGEDYAWRAVDIPACSVNAPHIRNRLYWVAYPESGRGRTGFRERREIENRHGASGGGGATGGLDDPQRAGLEIGSRQRKQRLRAEPESVAAGLPDRRLEHPAGFGRGEGRPQHELRSGRHSPALAGGATSGLEHPDGSQRGSQAQGRSDVDDGPDAGGSQAASGSKLAGWADYELIGPDPNGQYRRVKSGIRLLAHGLSGRVAQLRGLGNAIVPEEAAEVMRAWLDCEREVSGSTH